MRIEAGARTDIDPNQALAVARAAEPATPRASQPQDGDPLPGERARVRANDNAKDWVEGEVSFIDDSPRTVSVKATEASVIRSWDKKTLSEALAFDPQLLAKFAVAMSELLVERLRDMAKRV